MVRLSRWSRKKIVLIFAATFCLLHVSCWSFESNAENVFAALVNPNGCILKSFETHFDLTIDSIENSVSEMSICLWINPFRFRETSKLLGIYPFCSDCITPDAKLLIKMSNDIIFLEGLPETNAKLRPYEWQHVCLLYGSNASIFLNQMKHEVHTKSPIKPLDLNYHLTVELGADNIMEFSFSGMVADVRLYFRLISETEVAKIGKFQDVETDYKTLSVEKMDYYLNENATHFYDYIYTPNVKYIYEWPTSNEFYEMSRNHLLKKVSEKFVTKFYDPVSCSAAREICPAFGGYIPFFEKESDLEELYEMVHDYMMVSMQNVQSFWMLRKSRGVESCVKSVFSSKTGKLWIINCTLNETQTLPAICVLTRNKQFQFKSDMLSLPIIHIPNTYHVYESLTEMHRYMWSMEKHSVEMINLRYNTLHDFVQVSEGAAGFVGRKNWTINGVISKMLISTCTEGQFSCDSGNCIAIRLVCNYEKDCPDASDESFCEAVILPTKGYEKRLAPVAQNNEKRSVLLNLLLGRVDEIDMEASSIKLHFLLTVKWSDYRLAFKYLSDNESKYIHKSTLEQIWNPRITIPEGVSDSDKTAFHLHTNFGTSLATATGSGKLFVVNSYEIVKFEGKDVRIITRKSANVALNCRMQLYMFPFDVQECNFSLLLERVIGPNVEWDNESTVSIHVGEERLALYSNLKFFSTFDPINGNEFQVTVSVKRRNGAYIFTIFLPCSILEVIGLFTLFLPHDDYQDRVTVTLSCLIVLSSLFTQVSSSLPTSADPKIIDVWLFIHIFLLFLIFLLHIFIILLHHNMNAKNPESEKEEDNDYEVYLAKRLRENQTKLAPRTVQKAWKLGPRISKVGTWQKKPLYVKINYFGIALYVSCYVGVLAYFFRTINGV